MVASPATLLPREDSSVEVKAATVPDDEFLTQRLSVLTSELRHAWDRSTSADLQRWGTQSVSDFATVFSRRVSNFLSLLLSFGDKTLLEAREAFVAYDLNNLEGHLQGRLSTLGANVTALHDRAVSDMSALGDALKSRPADVAPKLLTALITSLLVSGGPDADGGAPDLDLVFGIGAHRSIFSHSILMGSALETAFLSLLRLVRLVHAKLPEGHSRGWDEVAKYGEQVVSGAIAGAGLGMAYHLIIDGLVQTGTLHGLPFPMSQEAHDAVTAGGGFIEAQDLASKSSKSIEGGKPVTSALVGPTGRTTVEEEAAHKVYLRKRTEISPLTAALLPVDCLPVIQRHGAWLTALADGSLRPLSPAQEQLLRVASWDAEPQTLHEHSWYAYCLVHMALFQSFRPRIGNSVREWLAGFDPRPNPGQSSSR